MKRFNVRVYGLVISENKILVSDEERFNMQFTKFPGGGLEFGEGVLDCLKRECMEELGLQLVNSEHYYTTDFFQESAVNPEDQLISIYYKITLADLAQLNVSLTKFDFKEISEEMISLRWIPLSDISASDFTFPVDKHVAELLKYDFEKN